MVGHRPQVCYTIVYIIITVFGQTNVVWQLDNHERLMIMDYSVFCFTFALQLQLFVVFTFISNYVTCGLYIVTRLVELNQCFSLLILQNWNGCKEQFRPEFLFPLVCILLVFLWKQKGRHLIQAQNLLCYPFLWIN